MMSPCKSDHSLHLGLLQFVLDKRLPSPLCSVGSGAITPLTGRHAGSLLTCWLDFNQVGLALRAHPLGNINQFHGFSPTPKVSGLPWREQAVVRWSALGSLVHGDPHG